jgi:nitrogen-specific signal transduction histidine kinase/CheY-like chemotaxis protein
MPSEQLCDEEGQALYCAGVVQDITERKRAEAAGEQQARLAAVGQLAAGIAHDFNNILSVILIYAEMLREAKGLTHKERERAETIATQTLRATGMIRQILDFSRQSVFERHMLDLLPLLKEQVKLLKQTLPENIAVELHYAPGEYCVIADATRMQQMVMNLALNARDAMPHGGTLRIALAHTTQRPAVHLAEEVGQHTGEWVQIEVEDTGEGMSAPVQARVFEPFFTTKEVGKGVGLGLAQVHGIVAQHDGCIDVRSAPGAGTCFRVWLPAHADSGKAAAGCGQLLRGLPRGNGQCVLLVEDDEALRATLAELLEGLDYAVVQAADGEEALRCMQARNGAVDLVISDVVMPRLGGIELLQELRRMGSCVPVILMSGHDTSLQNMQMRAAGAGVFLHKPPAGQDLAAAVERLLEGCAGDVPHRMRPH